MKRLTRSLLTLLLLSILLCALLPQIRADDASEVESDAAVSPSSSSPESVTEAEDGMSVEEVELEVEDPPEPVDPSKPPPISLSQADYCRACYSVVEEFHKTAVNNFIDPAARKNQTMTRSELVEWFCRTGPFEHWKEGLMWGCIKTVQDHHEEVLDPWIGTHTINEYTTLSKVFEHKVKVCAKIDACSPWVPEGRSKNDCETCERVVKDLNWSLMREQTINETVVKRTLGALCMEVGMRHDKPMEVEAFCHEHVDEHWRGMQKMVLRVYTDADIPAWDKMRQVKREFCGGMTEVCEAERKEMAAVIRERKKKKKEALAALKEARKIGATREQRLAAEALKEEL